MAKASDEIVKSITLKAPLARVWRAISDHEQFGTWFRVKLDGPFVPGGEITGQITHPGFEHVKFTAVCEAVDPMTYFAMKWRPYAIDPNVDYSSEPMTLVEFRLRAVDDATTHLEIRESGFDRVPAHRRDEAFRMNEGGWEQQLKNIEAHVIA